MNPAFTLKPHVGVLPMRFGMSEADVASVLGPPERVSQNYLAEREEQRAGVFVRYSKAGGRAAEISLLPTEKLLFDGTDLFSEKEPIGVLLRTDPDPFEWVGFVIFLSLGVAVTGYHDNDRSQQAITAFEQGRWDAYREQFTPLRK